MLSIKYRLVEKTNLVHFEDTINLHLQNGWRLEGSTRITETYDSKNCEIKKTYYQTLIFEQELK